MKFLDQCFLTSGTDASTRRENIRTWCEVDLMMAVDGLTMPEKLLYLKVLANDDESRLPLASWR